MNTPGKISNKESYASPYGMSRQQYPSQSSDFISFDDDSKQSKNQKRERFSGTPIKRFQRNDSGDFGGGGGNNSGGGWEGSTPIPQFYRNVQPQYFDGDDGESSYSRNNQARNYNNRYFGGSGSSYTRRGGGQSEGHNRGFHQRQLHHYRRSGGGSYGDQRQGNSTMQKLENNSLGIFFHPSMLEDPWEELVKRRNKLRQLSINLEKPVKEHEDDNSDDSLDETDAKSDKISNEEKKVEEVVKELSTDIDDK